MKIQFLFTRTSTESLGVDLIGSTDRITDTCPSPWPGWCNTMIAQDWVSCHPGDGSDSAPPNETNEGWGSVVPQEKSGRRPPQEGETNLAN